MLHTHDTYYRNIYLQKLRTTGWGLVVECVIRCHQSMPCRGMQFTLTLLQFCDGGLTESQQLMMDWACAATLPSYK